MILDVSVHPDDSIFQIKQIILNSATADGKHTGRFDSNFSHIFKSNTKFELLYYILVAVGLSGILKAKQKLGVTFNSNKLGGIDFTKFSKLTMCSA